MAASWAERCAEEAGIFPRLCCREVSQRPVLADTAGASGGLRKHLLLCGSICWFSYDFEAWRLKLSLI